MSKIKVNNKVATYMVATLLIAVLVYIVQFAKTSFVSWKEDRLLSKAGLPVLDIINDSLPGHAKSAESPWNLGVINWSAFGWRKNTKGSVDYIVPIRPNEAYSYNGIWYTYNPDRYTFKYTGSGTSTYTMLKSVYNKDSAAITNGLIWCLFWIPTVVASVLIYLYAYRYTLSPTADSVEKAKLPNPQDYEKELEDLEKRNKKLQDEIHKKIM